jgi:hypothetical protein
MLFVSSGEAAEDREILGFDLSGKIENGMEPTLVIGGKHATVACDLPRVERLLAIDEKHRRLYSGLSALDISGDVRKQVKLIGWFGLGPHADAAKEQDHHSGPLPSLLGYSVGFCDRFGGACSAMAVDPQSGTVYASDTGRYRVLAYEPEFRFRTAELVLENGAPVTDISGTGGLSPLALAISGGKLPAGVTLDERSGILSGTPRDAPGTYEVELTVTTPIETARGKLTMKLEAGD